MFEELEALVDLFDDSPDLQAFFTSPLIEAEARKPALESMFRGRLSDVVVDTLQVLNRKGRLEILPTLVAVFRADLRERQGRINVEVHSAVELDKKMKRKLEKAIESWVGKKAVLRETCTVRTWWSATRRRCGTRRTSRTC